MTKKPSNRNSLPKVIINKVDESSILEFKIKYEKLARLDRFEVRSMRYDGDGRIIFDEVVANAGLLDVDYEDDNRTIVVKIENKAYNIYGKKVGGEKRLNGKISKAKVQLILTDSIRKNANDTHRHSLTERELINKNEVDLYSKIAEREISTTKDIYLVKRFLAYRSDLLLYYAFINHYVRVNGNKKEFWKTEIDDKIIDYFIYTINDTLKNKEGYLEKYIVDRDQIKKDLEKIKQIFSHLRHKLMHYDFRFFTDLFDGKDVDIKVDNSIQKISELLDIEFLNIVIDKLEKLNIDAKKEFIDDEKITLFGQEIELKKLYSLYAHTSINRVAFNKLINSFLIKDGVENKELKEYFNAHNQGKESYYIDIHQNQEYKKLYIEHKNLVAKLSATTDGKEIAKINRELADKKEQMKQITKANSLKRLEYKLRLAFGFIYTEYKDYERFKNSFDTDTKKKKFDAIDNAKIIEYFEATNKAKKIEKLEEILKGIDKLSLKTLIQDDILLKFLLLFFTFLPQEIKGEFLGFIKKYYHDITSLDEDTKDKDDEITELPRSLKLKIFSKNIRKLSILKHSLSYQIKYNKKESSYYEAGNVFNKMFKKQAISHNLEEFGKSIYLPMLKYYSALYKLINDFEIYALYKDMDTSETLSQQVDKQEYKRNEYFNFETLLRKKFGNDIEKVLVTYRNKIAHLDFNFLYDKPINKFISLYKSREKIVNYIKNHDIQAVLKYDAVNDFVMKVIQLRTKLKVYADKEQTIESMIQNTQNPNGFYNIYKVKAVENINRHLLKVIGYTESEKAVEEKIRAGNTSKS